MNDPSQTIDPARRPARANYGAGPLNSLSSGGFRLFRLFGITVFLHWSWLLVAVYEIQSRREVYRDALGWNIAEYVTLFLIVLLHEFGHALACKSVGGIAERIILWPFGGVAFVQPPQRAGAMLWSIAAGPLVNVLLVPVLFMATVLSVNAPLNVQKYVHAVQWINLLLLGFNLLPIYPLDGGQILRSLLWFVVGRTWSLLVASVIGLVGAVALVCIFVLPEFLAHGFDTALLFPLALIAFLGMQAWAGLQAALAMRRFEQIPRYAGPRCPACGAAPPALPMWRCARCGTNYDTFASLGTCPGCGLRPSATACFDCGHATPMQAWFPEVQAPSPAHVPAQVPSL